MSESIKMRQRVERMIARRVILDAKAVGCRFNIDNGGDDLELPAPTDKVKDVLAAMFATDDERLVLYKSSDKTGWARLGWVTFVYGNGADVISDYSSNLGDLLKGALDLADKYA